MTYIIEFNKLSKDNNCITIANIIIYIYSYINNIILSNI